MTLGPAVVAGLSSLGEVHPLVPPSLRRATRPTRLVGLAETGQQISNLAPTGRGQSVGPDRTYFREPLGR